MSGRRMRTTRSIVCRRRASLNVRPGSGHHPARIAERDDQLRAVATDHLERVRERVERGAVHLLGDDHDAHDRHLERVGELRGRCGWPPAVGGPSRSGKSLSPMSKSPSGRSCSFSERGSWMRYEFTASTAGVSCVMKTTTHDAGEEREHEPERRRGATQRRKRGRDHRHEHEDRRADDRRATT